MELVQIGELVRIRGDVAVVHVLRSIIPASAVRTAAGSAPLERHPSMSTPSRGTGPGAARRSRSAKADPGAVAHGARKPERCEKRCAHSRSATRPRIMASPASGIAEWSATSQDSIGLARNRRGSGPVVRDRRGARAACCAPGRVLSALLRRGVGEPCGSLAAARTARSSRARSIGHQARDRRTATGDGDGRRGEHPRTLRQGPTRRADQIVTGRAEPCMSTTVGPPSGPTTTVPRPPSFTTSGTMVGRAARTQSPPRADPSG